MDKIYTPDSLATWLSETCSVEQPATIADFAAGDGALLSAAIAKWPCAKTFAADVDRKALSVLKSRIVDCRTYVCDFLSESSLKCSRVLKSLEGKCDLILLNPPFSSRGRRSFKTRVAGVDFYASKALAFVCLSLRYLRQGGEVLAIVPASCVSSERDSALFQAVCENYNVSEVGGRIRSAFHGRSVTVVVLRIQATQPQADFVQRESRVRDLTVHFNVEVMRGSLPMYRVQRTGSIPVIHTCNLKGQKVVFGDNFTDDVRKVVRGAAVLIQRIGRPSVDKIAINGPEVVAISDCVIALRTNPPGHEQALKAILISEWAHFEARFGGSCAPYLTIASLRDGLLDLGIASDILKTMETSGSVEEKVDEDVRCPVCAGGESDKDRNTEDGCELAA